MTTQDHPPPPPLARLLALALDNLSRQLQARIKEAGFTDQRMAHNAVFAHMPPEGITLAELARRAGMTKQAMSELVVDLEAKGYLTRRADDQDKRTKVIELSDRGWAAMSVALAAFAEIERGLERELGAERLKAFRRTLEMLAT
jgi:DNA-binding MarR family transcriptional regulator